MECGHDCRRRSQYGCRAFWKRRLRNFEASLRIWPPQRHSSQRSTKRWVDWGPRQSASWPVLPQDQMETVWRRELLAWRSKLWTRELLSCEVNHGLQSRHQRQSPHPRSHREHAIQQSALSDSLLDRLSGRQFKDQRLMQFESLFDGLSNRVMLTNTGGQQPHRQTPTSWLARIS
jgi:hypothetical protein